MSESHARQGPETRIRILDAAEKLFMEHGFDGTSMRMITSSAKVNLAAVNYHFGSKDALIQEVFRRRLSAMNKGAPGRARCLDRGGRRRAAQAQPHRRGLFGTSLEMAADTEHGGYTFMRLLGRTYTEPNSFVRQFLAEEYSECVERFLAELYRSLPGCRGGNPVALPLHDGRDLLRDRRYRCAAVVRRQSSTIVIRHA